MGDMNKRAGELTEEEVEKLITIITNPRQYKIPDWFLNRQKDIVDGKFSQVMSNSLDNKLREDLERMKKIRAHRGLRHYWGLRVRGQHTKTTDCFWEQVVAWRRFHHPNRARRLFSLRSRFFMNRLVSLFRSKD